jgi:predicted histone-like DNA-binding protein
MAADRSTLTSADMMAAIETFLSIVPQQLMKGNIVELGQFGTFWLRTTANGAETPDEVNADQISSLLPRFNPGKRFKKALKTVDYVRGTVVSEPEAEPEPA